MRTQSPVALVTGASSGIGRAIAVRLARGGYRVFGTARQPERLASEPGFEPVRMDVREDDSVARAVETVLGSAGRIDLLANNAGYSVVGAVEETSPAQARSLFETNVFGALRVSRAVLPAMRARGKGRIVNISSVAGFAPPPFMGAYAASKHALEALTEALDYEVRNFGVRAVLVQPGFTRTEIASNQETADALVEVYAALREGLTAHIVSAVAAGVDPDVVAEVVWTAATAESPRLRYPVGREARALAAMRRFLPARAFAQGVRKQFRLDSV
jgi:NAD(P)-dependent dehydrogenase (short-subunit alcohol dehydrogenase family)